MILYCHDCEENHDFTNGEAERIIYALQAGLVTEIWDGGPENANGNEPEENFECLKDWLSRSREPELFLEHVESEVECRLFHAHHTVTVKGSQT